MLQLRYTQIQNQEKQYQDLQRLLKISPPVEEQQFSTQNNYTQIINNFRGPKSINNFTADLGDKNTFLPPKP
jgi:hypothetical protein